MSVISSNTGVPQIKVSLGGEVIMPKVGIVVTGSYSTQKESLKQSYADKPEIRPGQYYKTPVRCSDLEVWWFPHPS